VEDIPQKAEASHAATRYDSSIGKLGSAILKRATKGEGNVAARLYILMYCVYLWSEPDGKSAV
jgi:hypothetical protein